MSTTSLHSHWQHTPVDLCSHIQVRFFADTSETAGSETAPTVTVKFQYLRHLGHGTATRSSIGSESQSKRAVVSKVSVRTKRHKAGDLVVAKVKPDQEWQVTVTLVTVVCVTVVFVTVTVL
jgi:hypothetical protein